MQAQGEHTNSIQVESWMGFEPMVHLVLLGGGASHCAFDKFNLFPDARKHIFGLSADWL